MLWMVSVKNFSSLCCGLMQFHHIEIVYLYFVEQLMMGDIDNHQRLVNELAERVANLEALSENSEVAESLQDVQNRYDRVRTRCRVCRQHWYFL